jgi:hypothetical protein
LDCTITEFVLPRLKLFRQRFAGRSVPCFPEGMTSEEWCAIQDKMIAAFQLMYDEEVGSGKWNQENQEIIEEGLRLFATYYQSLWD